MNSATGSCPIWGTNDFYWEGANWWWSMCYQSGSIPPITSSVVILQQPGVDATTLIQPWLIEPWNPYRAGEIKRKKRVKVIVKMNGKTYEEEKEVDEKNESEISVDDVELVMEKINIINVKKLEE